MCEQAGQAQYVVRGTTEDEQPIDLVQFAQLGLAQRSGLLEIAEAPFDQQATAQADGIARLAGSSPIQVAGAVVVVLRHMRGHIQFSYRAHEIFRVIGLVCAQGDAPAAAHLLAAEHQQRGIAFRKSVGMSHHGRGDQSVAVLHQSVAQVAQLQFPAVALPVDPGIGIGGGLVRLVAPLLAMEVECDRIWTFNDLRGILWNIKVA
jgi:hypothetical protein